MFLLEQCRACWHRIIDNNGSVRGNLARFVLRQDRSLSWRTGVQTSALGRYRDLVADQVTWAHKCPRAPNTSVAEYRGHGNLVAGSRLDRHDMYLSATQARSLALPTRRSRTNSV